MAVAATAADVLVTTQDALDTAADVVSTGNDVIAAAASAASAAAIAGAFVGTSTTSLLIALGNKSFTTQSGEQYTSGVYITAVSAANGANFMFGQVVSYSGSTLVLDVQVTGGSGTYADWNLSLAGIRGAAGAGVTEQSTGFTLTGGTSARTLTVLSTGTAALLGANVFTAIQEMPYLKVTNGATAGRILTSDAAGNATWQAPVVPPSGFTYATMQKFS